MVLSNRLRSPRLLSRMAILGALVAAPLPAAFAGSSAATMPITASVTPVCVVSAAALNFGNYDPILINSTTPLDATGTITVQCIRNSSYTVTLDQGQNGTATTRSMKESGGSLLSYDLYTDSARTTVWNTANTVTGTAPSSAPIALSVYGRIPPAQNVAAGSYSDVVNVTVNF